MGLLLLRSALKRSGVPFTIYGILQGFKPTKKQYEKIKKYLFLK
jgi:hypothetical protein